MLASGNPELRIRLLDYSFKSKDLSSRKDSPRHWDTGNLTLEQQPPKINAAVLMGPRDCNIVVYFKSYSAH